MEHRSHVIAYYASPHMLSESQFDAAGDGEVEPLEFRESMKLLGLELPDGIIDQLFKMFDLNGDGVISYQVDLLEEDPCSFHVFTFLHTLS